MQLPLGETKFSSKKARAYSLLDEATEETNFYVSLPSEPEKDWDYDFGFGLAYAGGGAGTRQSYLIDKFWKEKRLVIACFEAK